MWPRWPRPAGWQVNLRTLRGLGWLSRVDQQEFLTERNVALVRKAYESIGADGVDDAEARSGT